MRTPAALRVLTAGGRSVLLVGVVSYLLDAVGGWPVFQLVWVTCALMGAAAVAFLLVPLRGRVDLQVAPARTVAGGHATVTLRARSAGRFPLPGPLVEVPVGAVRHVVRLPTLHRRRTAEATIEIDDLHRGVLGVGPVEARRTDPLGLLRWTERWSSGVELVVLPRMVPVPMMGGGVIRDQEGTPSDEVSLSDLAFHALREYVPGDDLRHVHWRSSAKADKLLVRQYHDTRRSHLTLVVDDNRGSYGAPEDFETSVSTAASIAARADRDGVDLSLLCGEHATTRRGLDAVLDACARVELDSSDPAQGARAALRLAPETSWLVMVTGGTAPEALPAALRAALPPDVSLLLVCCDGWVATGLSEAGAGVRLLGLRALDDLPRALGVAAPAVQT